MWQRQLHLFHVPFYYIEYGIAQLGALQIYNNAKQDTQKAIDAYRRGLALGGTRPLPELFEAADIKFDFGDKHDRPADPDDPRRPGEAAVVSRTRVKICGVRTPDDAVLAADAGADAVGFVLYAPGAKRLIDVEMALEIVKALPPYVTAVAVMVDPPPFILRQLLSAVPVDVVQFHGNEGPDLVRQATTNRATKVLRADANLAASVEHWTRKPTRNLAGLHVDSASGGGSGTSSDWETVAALPEDVVRRLVLAGGLTPDNVCDVVRRFRPFAVDVSSGVESNDGRKSFELVTRFVNAVREADAAPG